MRTENVIIVGSSGATGPLTDAQLRATAVPVSGPLTDAQLASRQLNVQTREDAASAVVSSGIGTASAPTDGAILVSVTSTPNKTMEITFSVSSDELAAAGGFIDLVIRAVGDGSDVAIIATFTAAGSHDGAIRYPLAANQLIKLRKVGNATASTSYRAAINARQVS